VKFIVDAQLPKSLSDFLKSKNHDSIHTLDFSTQNKTTDIQIVNLSVKEGGIVITKDTDFLESFLLSGKPPKLLLITTGNIKNSALIGIFQSQIAILSKLFAENSLIEINKTEIVVHA
jgi:predicted nuclease of predicted toxin-antitoxin system